MRPPTLQAKIKGRLTAIASSFWKKKIKFLQRGNIQDQWEERLLIQNKKE